MPLMPPVTKNETNPMEYSIGVVKRIFAPHNVPIQLKVLIAEGTPMTIVNMEKTNAE